jgi:hypothetical protein
VFSTGRPGPIVGCPTISSGSSKSGGCSARMTESASAWPTVGKHPCPTATKAAKRRRTSRRTGAA